MAIGRLSMKVGKAGKASPHAAYIAREGRYAERLERGEKLEAREAGNLPAWAQAQPLVFWQAADAFERANGTTYREIELALPRELTPAQRLELVREFVRQEIGEQHAYQWAIHSPTASDGQEQPHAHLMFSERRCDGIARDPEQYFRRYNTKAPELGGARKGYGPHAGQRLSQAERVADLKALRGRWQDMVNAHLERAGQTARVDLRSHAELGTGEAPEAKQLPSQWRGEGRAKVIEFRKAKAELQEATRALQQAVPDASNDVSYFEDQRLRREEEAAQKRREDEEARQARDAAERARAQAGERQRWLDVIEQMSADQIWAQIAQRRPPSLHELVESDPAVIDGRRQAYELDDRLDQGKKREARAWQETLRWREAHPMRAKVHDLGLVRAGYLVEREGICSDAERLRKVLEPQKEEAWQRVQALRAETARRIGAELAPVWAEITELETIAKRKDAEEAARKQLAKEFRGMAARRAMKAYGCGDNGKEWQATPKLLREIIDEYNRRPKEQQERGLSGWLDNPGQSQAIATMIEQCRGRSREIDRGMSR